MLTLLTGVSVTLADDYVEDVYYWADVKTHSQNGTAVPNYNTRVREVVFVEGSTAVRQPDTVQVVQPAALPMENIQ